MRQPFEGAPSSLRDAVVGIGIALGGAGLLLAAVLHLAAPVVVLTIPSVAQPTATSAAEQRDHAATKLGAGVVTPQTRPTETQRHDAAPSPGEARSHPGADNSHGHAVPDVAHRVPSVPPQTSVATSTGSAPSVHPAAAAHPAFAAHPAVAAHPGVAAHPAHRAFGARSVSPPPSSAAKTAASAPTVGSGGESGKAAAANAPAVTKAPTPATAARRPASMPSRPIVAHAQVRHVASRGAAATPRRQQRGRRAAAVDPNATPEPPIGFDERPSLVEAPLLTSTRGDGGASTAASGAVDARFGGIRVRGRTLVVPTPAPTSLAPAP